MEGVKRLVCAIWMVLILSFGLIHVAVSISVISKFHSYGNIFRPEIGLASFNIVIGVYALLVGGFGLFAVLTYRDVLSEVVAIASTLLVIFTIASLITALVINSLSITYVNSRFTNYMSSYQQSQQSENIIDLVQTDYDCCGSYTWLDWYGLISNSTQSSTSTTTAASVTTTAGGVGATSASGGGGATTAAVVDTTAGGGGVTTVAGGGGTTAGVVDTTAGGGGATTAAVIDTTAGGSGASAATGGANTDSGATVGGGTEATSVAPANDMINTDSMIGKREILDTTIKNSISENRDTSNAAQNSYPQPIRQKRQMSSSNSSMYGLPSSYNIILPQSCCTDDLSTITVQNPYCMSNANNYHTTGCAKGLTKRSLGQTIGIAVINSCLFILSLGLIALIVVATHNANPQQNQQTNHPAQHSGYASHPAQQNGYASHPAQHSGYASHPAQQNGYATQPAQHNGYANYSMQHNAYANQPMQQYPQTYGAQGAAVYFPGMGYNNNYYAAAPISQYF